MHTKKTVSELAPVHGDMVMEAVKQTPCLRQSNEFVIELLYQPRWEQKANMI